MYYSVDAINKRAHPYILNNCVHFKRTYLRHFEIIYINFGVNLKVNNNDNDR